MILKPTYDLLRDYEQSKIRLSMLENKLNNCTPDEVDELIYDLKAEQTRFGRLIRELQRVPKG